MDMTTRLRRAREADIDAMHRVRLSVIENRLASTVLTASDYQRETQSDGQGWVIESDGEIVGFAAGNRATGNIWALFVDPRYERRGFGRRLLETVVDWLWEQGLERLWLTTRPNTRAARLYERAGWHGTLQPNSPDMLFELRRVPRSRE